MSDEVWNNDILEHQWSRRFHKVYKPKIRMDCYRGINCYPDMVFTDINKAWRVAVERKESWNMHRLSEALGQAMMYKLKAPHVIITFPFNRVMLATKWVEIVEANGIHITEDKDLPALIEKIAPECMLTKAEALRREEFMISKGFTDPSFADGLPDEPILAIA